MNIDAKGLILGRLGTVVAKKALLGEQINIYNCNEVVITGEKKRIFNDYKRKREMGTHSTGPFQPKVSFKFVKRSIRGMLPYKKSKGREALDRIKCFNGMPEEGVKMETIDNAHIDNTLVSKFINVKELCKLMGGKVE